MLQQRKARRWLGTLLLIYTQGAIIFSPLTYAGVAVSLYTSNTGLWMKEAIPWMSFGWFALLVFGVSGLLMTAYYIFVYPSQIKASNEQACLGDRHPVMKELAEIKALLKSRTNKDVH